MDKAAYMSQRSVFAQTTQPVEKTSKKLLHDKVGQLLQTFFVAEITPENYRLFDLQRRALWIGVAIFLQTLNEIDHDWYIPYLMPVGSLIPFVLILGSFVAMWMALRPASQPRPKTTIKRTPTRWQKFMLFALLILSVIGAVELGRGLIMCVLPPQFSNDGTSLDTNAAMLLLEGHNPYTDSNMLDIYRNQNFTLEPNWTTPLRQGQFANRYDYPSIAEFRSALDTALKAGEAPEFESKVSYPALSFLTLLPFALFKNYNVLPLYLASYLFLVAIAWKASRPEIRPWVLLLGIANVPMWSSTVGGNLDVLCTLFVVIAWLLRERRWSTSLFFGLALASKQTAWFIAPFYFVMLWRLYGFKEAVYRCTLASMFMLLINMPFILWNPHAWLAGIFAPMADPMFPMGVGLVGLSVTHLIPFLPTSVYTLLEGVTMIAMLYVYWRICRKRPEAAFLLAIIPLFFAWRSLPSYFYCAALPMFIVISSRLTPLPGQALASAFSTMLQRNKVGMASSLNTPLSM